MLLLGTLWRHPKRRRVLDMEVRRYAESCREPRGSTTAKSTKSKSQAIARIQVNFNRRRGRRVQVRA